MVLLKNSLIQYWVRLLACQGGGETRSWPSCFVSETLRSQRRKLKLLACILIPLGYDVQLLTRKQQALKSVHINIFDFLDVIGAVTDATVDPWMRYSTTLLSPSACSLKFPSDEMLAIYSAFTRKVFPRFRAKQDGMLVLLLHGTRQHLPVLDKVLDELEDEARDPSEAGDDGLGAVRKVLLPGD